MSVHSKGMDDTLDTVPERETPRNCGGEVVAYGDSRERSSAGLGVRIGRAPADE